MFPHDALTGKLGPPLPATYLREYHSYRSAFAGRIRAIRSEGITEAATATAISAAATLPNTNGSVGRTPYSMVVISRVIASAPATPIPSPIAALRSLTDPVTRSGIILIAISNHRPVALVDGEVVFRWRDSAHKNKKRLMRLELNEFLRRFFLHVLPKGFVRIRHFGFFAYRRRAKLLPLCFALLC